MPRRILILVYLASIFPQRGWAAMGQGLEVGLPAVPALVLPAWPGLPAVDFSALATLKAASPVGPAIPALARAGARSAAGAAQAALPGLAAAALSASALRARPGGAESDARRADFTLGPAAVPALSDDPVPAAASASEGFVGLAPAARGPTRPARLTRMVPEPRGQRGYVLGVLASEIGSSALVVALPLALLSLGQSLSSLAVLTTFATGFDAAGTLLGGRLCARLNTRSTLTTAIAVRAASLLGAAALLAWSGHAWPAVAALYCVDAFARGVGGTARNTIAIHLAGKRRDVLERLNSVVQTISEASAVAGPALMIPLLLGRGLLANWFVGAAFAAATLAYLHVPRAPPRREHSAPSGRHEEARGDFSRSWRRLRSSVATGVVLSLTPTLRELLPALFAVSVLHSSAQAAPLVLAFGLAGTVGSALYHRLHGRLSTRGWLRLASAGAGVLALSALAHSFWPMALGIMVFSASNAMARLAVNADIQVSIPDGCEAAVMVWQRLGAKLASVVLRLVIVAALAAFVDPARSLVWVAAGIAALAALQWACVRCFGTAAPADLRGAAAELS
ncbi:MAG: hypothetical protein KGO96_06705 [Elusimicrobia bacterium]|nr:hypothetical protein [Elusimicrobiota bacterium]MDE2425581.1 hypothetical protein [Elusimicrobiota bacterium]